MFTFENENPHALFRPRRIAWRPQKWPLGTPWCRNFHLKGFSLSKLTFFAKISRIQNAPAARQVCLDPTRASGHLQHANSTAGSCPAAAQPTSACAAQPAPQFERHRAAHCGDLWRTCSSVSAHPRSCLRSSNATGVSRLTAVVQWMGAHRKIEAKCIWSQRLCGAEFVAVSEFLWHAATIAPAARPRTIPSLHRRCLKTPGPAQVSTLYDSPRTS